jgi:hypothetical protein
MTGYWHAEVHHLTVLGEGAALFYAGGLAFWLFSVFFRQDYWSRSDIGRCFIWPWLALRARSRRRGGS